MAIKTRQLPANFDSLLNKRQVADLLATSVSTIDRMLASSSFPREDRRVGIGRGSLRWRRSTVQSWIDGNMDGQAIHEGVS